MRCAGGRYAVVSTSSKSFEIFTSTSRYLGFGVLAGTQGHETSHANDVNIERGVEGRSLTAARSAPSRLQSNACACSRMRVCRCSSVVHISRDMMCVPVLLYTYTSEGEGKSTREGSTAPPASRRCRRRSGWPPLRRCHSRTTSPAVRCGMPSHSARSPAWCEREGSIGASEPRGSNMGGWDGGMGGEGRSEGHGEAGVPGEWTAIWAFVYDFPAPAAIARLDERLVSRRPAQHVACEGACNGRCVISGRYRAARGEPS